MPKRTTITAFFSALPSSQTQDAPTKRRRVEPRSPLRNAISAGNVASRKPLTIEDDSDAGHKADQLPALKHAPAKARPLLHKPISTPLATRSSPGPQSPPSSPRRSPSSSPELFRTRPSTFALLRHRAAAASQRASSCPPAADPPKKRRKAQQMTLDLGQKTTRTCPDCGMSYTPTQREDAALHARFHTQSAAESRGAAPPRISPQTVKALLAGNGVCSISGGGGGASGAIVCVRPGDEAAKRRAAETCLRVAERELGAVEMRAEELWGQKELKSAGESGDAYRLFMCLRGQQCVGLLLAERIETARAAVSQAGGTALSDGEVVPATQELSPVEDCPVFASNEEYPAVLGIARIWTARSARRSGVAQGLLEQACRNFLPGAVVETDRVAFSQPTQMGARLARRFFGKKWGWLVYTG